MQEKRTGPSLAFEKPPGAALRGYVPPVMAEALREAG